MKKNYQMNYLVNFVWGNNMQIRKNITNENNELIKTLLIQKKDLKKIIEFDLDLTGEIKQIYDANANLDLDDYIEITSSDLTTFIMNINWIIDEETYINFSLTELEIAMNQIYKFILELNNNLLTTANPELQKYLKIEINKYEYMLNEINKLYVSKKYVKRRV